MVPSLCLASARDSGPRSAHQRWGARQWADNVQPAVELARAGATILPKTRDLYEEQEFKLRGGNAEIARLYLPNGQLPEVGSRVAIEDLAKTMEVFAEKGRDGFYSGPVAEAIVEATQRGGGSLTLQDLEHYEARITETIGATFREFRLECAPPPASGAMLFLPILKALEGEKFGGGPLRTADNLDKIGRVWRVVAREMWQIVGNMPESRFLCEKLLGLNVTAIRAQAFEAEPATAKVAQLEVGASYESEMAATTHFVIVDREGTSFARHNR
jgi:gamma-glutamyltranspeptidase / glutathione hydrolase